MTASSSSSTSADTDDDCGSTTAVCDDTDPGGGCEESTGGCLPPDTDTDTQGISPECSSEPAAEAIHSFELEGWAPAHLETFEGPCMVGEVQSGDVEIVASLVCTLGEQSYEGELHAPRPARGMPVWASEAEVQLRYSTRSEEDPDPSYPIWESISLRRADGALLFSGVSSGSDYSPPGSYFTPIELSFDHQLCVDEFSPSTDELPIQVTLAAGDVSLALVQGQSGVLDDGDAQYDVTVGRATTGVCCHQLFDLDVVVQLLAPQ